MTSSPLDLIICYNSSQELRETLNVYQRYYDYYYFIKGHVKKNTDKQPDEEIYRVRSERGWELLSPGSWGVLPS